ncbi:hypothetical protein LCGC14_0565070 [marine sediment metagenome]|uniref:Uncharacterized protein n=1 Tax=marine sediment metagenome TaxID=412755 RepID=A0A0F9RR44_9ZZZZ
MPRRFIALGNENAARELVRLAQQLKPECWETTREPHKNAGWNNRPPPGAVRLLGPRIRPKGRSKYWDERDADFVVFCKDHAEDLAHYVLATVE